VNVLLRARKGGDHVHVQVFMGPDREHRVLTGDLTLSIGEWQRFGNALQLSAVSGIGRGFISNVDIDGDPEVVAWLG